MKKKNIINIILILIIIFIVIDQSVKILVVNNYIKLEENSILKIQLIENEGMAFSLNNDNFKNILLTILILIIIIKFILKHKNIIDKKTAFSLSLILAGGMSNLIDRIFKGAVIDFIKIENFAIFNIADSYIVIGWILFIIFWIFNSRKMLEVKNCEKQ